MHKKDDPPDSALVWIVEESSDGFYLNHDPHSKWLAYVAEDLANALADRAFAHNDGLDQDSPLIYRVRSSFILNPDTEKV